MAMKQHCKSHCRCPLIAGFDGKVASPGLLAVFRTLEEGAQLFHIAPQSGKAVFDPAHHPVEKGQIHCQKQSPEGQEKPALEYREEQSQETQENEYHP
jgi:hypothetical protein